jgi:hypothetical protein
VSGFQIAGSHIGDPYPVDEVTMRFTMIRMAYTEPPAGGVVSVGYDLKQNKLA